MNFFSAALNWFLSQRIDEIKFFIRFPQKTQTQTLRNLVQTAAKTEFGKLHGFSSIQSPAEFSQRVPVQEYDTIKSDVTRMMKGEAGVLWPGKTKWFAKSSGTTSDKSKFIPVSRESLNDCHLKGGRDCLALFAHRNPGTAIFKGKSLVMGGSHHPNSLNRKSYSGDVSAVMMQNMPLLAHLLRTPDLSVALMENWEEKIEKMARQTIKQDVTQMVGVPTWTLVLLRRILEITQKKTILEVWPNLQLYIHGGVSFVPYREQFRQLIPSDKMQYLETYNASEGFFGIQYRRKASDMLLMLDYGVYYEFIPFDKPDEAAVPLWEVVPGINYAVVISTNAGLWRYKIGDTIQFTSISPYLFKITGRIRHFINAFGEEVMVDNADRAISAAAFQTGLQVIDYTVAPVFYTKKATGAHQWVIEFDQMPEEELLKQFLEILDSRLGELNSDYEAKRSGGIALLSPEAIAVPSGTFYEWMKARGKLGGQHKVPRLANDRQYVEQILNFVNQNRLEVLRITNPVN